MMILLRITCFFCKEVFNRVTRIALFSYANFWRETGKFVCFHVMFCLVVHSYMSNLLS